MSIRLRISLLLLVIICLLGLSAPAGCRHRPREANAAAELMAWSFARGVVTSRMAQPRKVFFPQFLPEFVERTGDDVFVVRATLGTVDEQGNPVSFNFSVTARYRGNDLFEAEEVLITQ